MVRTTARTDVGRQRSINEDAVLTASVDDTRHLLAVADGMGGHAAGDVASETALDAFGDAVATALDDGADPPDALADAVAVANDAVRDRAADATGEMGTTLVAALLGPDRAHVVNVGDSRCYHLDGGAEQVTVDQSLVRELVADGVIDPEEADGHPQRNVVSQALGTAESVDPDQYALDPTGTVLCCSDGLTEEVAEDAIAALVADAPDLATAADRLIARANENGGSDNVSVVLGAVD
jgi:protein phosphatase